MTVSGKLTEPPIMYLSFPAWFASWSKAT